MTQLKSLTFAPTHYRSDYCFDSIAFCNTDDVWRHPNLIQNNRFIGDVPDRHS